jgi:ABC-type nitrate/sulfonate/bicarbonate transport system ATPase subunit
MPEKRYQQEQGEVRFVRIEHLTKRFGGQALFEDLSLAFAGPLVLRAPSGWGKTTLLRILMGLETPDVGRVTGVGRAAAVFQEDRLCPQLNAVQNVELVLPAALGRAPQTREAIRQDFAALGMGGEALTNPAARLSGGQKRRAALLRALWAEADTLLLDEPFTGLDPEARAKAVELLRIRAGSRPVLLACHDAAAIEQLGWPVAELKKS